MNPQEPGKKELNLETLDSQLIFLHPKKTSPLKDEAVNEGDTITIITLPPDLQLLDFRDIQLRDTELLFIAQDGQQRTVTVDPMHAAWMRESVDVLVSDIKNNGVPFGIIKEGGEVV